MRVLCAALAGHWQTAESTQDQPLVQYHREPDGAWRGRIEGLWGQGPGRAPRWESLATRKGAAGGAAGRGTRRAVVQGPSTRLGSGGCGDAEHPALGASEAGWRGPAGDG